MSKVSVIPTDTLYGIVGSALDKQTVERIYAIRKRNPDKPCIILISSIEDLKLFHINLTKPTKDLLLRIWPGKVSVVLPCHSEEFEYLHRGTKTLAFRLPDKKDLVSLLKETGPLVSPSANPEGEEPAETIDQAKAYFGDAVDEYVDGGKLTSEPSTVVKFQDGELKVIRQGAKKI